MIDPAERAKTTYELILDKPSSIVFTKPRVVNDDGTVTPETALPPQVVRVNSDNRTTANSGAGESPTGLNPVRAVIVYGVVAHPTAPANDIEEGYTFPHEGDTYRVAHVIPGTPGVIQAEAELI